MRLIQHCLFCLFIAFQWSFQRPMIHFYELYFYEFYFQSLKSFQAPRRICAVLCPWCPVFTIIFCTVPRYARLRAALGAPFSNFEQFDALSEEIRWAVSRRSFFVRWSCPDLLRGSYCCANAFSKTVFCATDVQPIFLW